MNMKTRTPKVCLNIEDPPRYKVGAGPGRPELSAQAGCQPRPSPPHSSTFTDLTIPYMARVMKLALVLPIVVVLAIPMRCGAQGSPEYTMIGAGRLSCGTWVKYRDEKAASDIQQWILGFLSGAGFEPSPRYDRGGGSGVYFRAAPLRVSLRHLPSPAASSR